MRKQAIVTLSIVLVLVPMVVTVGCRATPGGKEVTIGNKNFTEQYVVGELMKQLLGDRGFTVELKSGRSSMCLREGMEFNDFGICAEYTGTAWMVHLAQEFKPGMDSNEIYKKVKVDEEDNGFIWLNPMWNNNTYALASLPEFIDRHRLRTLSDLASLYRERRGEIRTCVGLEFATRADGLPALETHYNCEVVEPYIATEPMAIPKQSLEKGMSDVAMVFGTDPEVAEHGWHIYLDDKDFFPPYDLTPYVRKEVLTKYPEIADILNELVASFRGGGEPATPEIVAEGQKVWQELNAKVDIEEMTPEKVANEYLMKHGLIK